MDINSMELRLYQENCHIPLKKISLVVFQQDSAQLTLPSSFIIINQSLQRRLVYHPIYLFIAWLNLSIDKM